MTGTAWSLAIMPDMRMIVSSAVMRVLRMPMMGASPRRYSNDEAFSPTQSVMGFNAHRYWVRFHDSSLSWATRLLDWRSQYALSALHSAMSSLRISVLGTRRRSHERNGLSGISVMVRLCVSGRTFADLICADALISGMSNACVTYA